MLGIAICCIQLSQAMLERGVCELAHSFFHYMYMEIDPENNPSKCIAQNYTFIRSYCVKL